MLALGVDTSNYATSLAVVNAAAGEVVCTQKRLLPVPRGAAGLRQSDAVFLHTAALPQMAEELAKTADFTRIAAVGVSEKPRPVQGSYMPCFLAGLSFAAALAAGRGFEPCRTSHQQGHLAAALFGAGLPLFAEAPLLFLHLSGGTTELLLCRGVSVAQKLGGSLDLHAGQLVDRLGLRLGYSFPAGEAVSRLAADFAGPRPPELKISVKGMNCHLSGLQNQCEALLKAGHPPAVAAAACLSALARTAAGMIRAARLEYPGLSALCAGGVMASEAVRARMGSELDGLYFASPALSADNAVGVALIAAAAAGRVG